MFVCSGMFQLYWSKVGSSISDVWSRSSRSSREGLGAGL